MAPTADGGVADVSPATYLAVTGKNYREEVRSFYRQMHRATELLRDDEQLAVAIRAQLTAYLPVISGARMLRDYLHYLFTK